METAADAVMAERINKLKPMAIGRWAGVSKCVVSRAQKISPMLIMAMMPMPEMGDDEDPTIPAI
ncbi:hypothetical protein AA15669_1662 [Saccharibacter floricola DSM 15669]|uniref:Transposase n=1 Tax=Saccharibacter floricola DSM 15669 TaxID=1123227 RepID=A0ABQ0P0E5_9PROT|nr:hypothetical protein AA15669_1662 [Saccharibacter floricola DSM 15669]